jgi:hypothetical protein
LNVVSAICQLKQLSLSRINFENIFSEKKKSFKEIGTMFFLADRKLVLIILVVLSLDLQLVSLGSQ